MYALNKRTDVHVKPYIDGTEKAKLVFCEHCQHNHFVYSEGKHRCQFVFLKKDKRVEFEGMYSYVNYFGQCNNAAQKLLGDDWFCITHANKILKGLKK